MDDEKILSDGGDGEVEEDEVDTDDDISEEDDDLEDDDDSVPPIGESGDAE